MYSYKCSFPCIHMFLSIFKTSPIFTNIGTCNSNPVSNVAGFPDVVVVFPANPGSVYVTSNSTNVGGSTANTFPFYMKEL